MGRHHPDHPGLDRHDVDGDGSAAIASSNAGVIEAPPRAEFARIVAAAIIIVRTAYCRLLKGYTGVVDATARRRLVIPWRPSADVRERLVVVARVSWRGRCRCYASGKVSTALRNSPPY